MKVLESKPGEVVKWKCIGGPEEWIGTELTFQPKREGDQTVVLFTHSGWREPVEFMHHCSTKWATFLLSLRDRVERGEGRPHPHDVKIHPKSPPWERVRFFLGSWAGTGYGQPGESRARREYHPVLKDRFIEVHNESRYALQPRNP